MRTFLACLATLATPCLAETRVAPEYYLDALFDASMAQQIALACPALSVNPAATSAMTGQVLERLEADGFDMANPDFDAAQAQAGFAARLSAFAERTGLGDGAATDVVCAVGRSEIDGATKIGALLVAVGP